MVSGPTLSLATIKEEEETSSSPDKSTGSPTGDSLRSPTTRVYDLAAQGQLNYGEDSLISADESKNCDTTIVSENSENYTNYLDKLEREVKLSVPGLAVVPASPPTTERSVFPLQSSSQTKFSARYEHVTLRRGSSSRAALPTISGPLAFNQSQRTIQPTANSLNVPTNDGQTRSPSGVSLAQNGYGLSTLPLRQVYVINTIKKTNKQDKHCVISAKYRVVFVNFYICSV